MEPARLEERSATFIGGPTDRRLSHRWIAAKASLKSRSRDSLPDTTPESMRRRSSVRRINRGRIALENRPPSRCSNPRLMHFNGPNSADDLPLWQMPIAHNQPLAILITSILVELNERRLPRFRSRPATACALLPGAISLNGLGAIERGVASGVLLCSRVDPGGIIRPFILKL